MIIFVDIDNTICQTIGMDYENAVPIIWKIEKINQLYQIGNQIVYWTSRGMGSGKDYRKLTTSQLKKWGCLYDELRLDKPIFDYLVDDKTFNDIDEIPV